MLDGGKLDDTLHFICTTSGFPKGGWVERLLLRRCDLGLPSPEP